MPVTVLIRDETTSGERTNERSLDFSEERVTVRELIRSRVYQEVKDHNVSAAQSFFRGLVQPVDAERALNGYRLKQPRQIDWKQQYEIAIAAFERRGYVILVNDRQVTDLEQEVQLQTGAAVSFLKLVPLVGG